MDDIKLPPLPHIADTFFCHLPQAFHDYARAAVELNREQPGEWVPRMGDTTWHNYGDGTHGKRDWGIFLDADDAYLAAHNVYRTEEEAKQGALRDVAMRKLLKAGLRFNVSLSDAETVVCSYRTSQDQDNVADAYSALTDAERAAIGGGR